MNYNYDIPKNIINFDNTNQGIEFYEVSNFNENNENENGNIIEIEKETGNTILHDSIKKKNGELTKYLIEEKGLIVMLSIKNKKNKSPLDLAIENNENWEVVGMINDWVFLNNYDEWISLVEIRNIMKEILYVSKTNEYSSPFSCIDDYTNDVVNGISKIFNFKSKNINVEEEKEKDIFVLLIRALEEIYEKREIAKLRYYHNIIFRDYLSQLRDVIKESEDYNPNKEIFVYYNLLSITNCDVDVKWINDNIVKDLNIIYDLKFGNTNYVGKPSIEISSSCGLKYYNVNVELNGENVSFKFCKVVDEISEIEYYKTFLNVIGLLLDYRKKDIKELISCFLIRRENFEKHYGDEIFRYAFKLLSVDNEAKRVENEL